MRKLFILPIVAVILGASAFFATEVRKPEPAYACYPYISCWCPVYDGYYHLHYSSWSGYWLHWHSYIAYYELGDC